MRNGILIAIIICIWALPAFSADINPQDFAYGLSLQVEGDGAIYKVPLPRSVYEGITRPDMGDIRVFNGAGEVVPFIIQHKESKTKKPRTPVSLPFFPLYQGKGRKPTALSLHITTDNRGSVVNLNSSGIEWDGAVLSAYLIDCSNLQHIPDRLRLEWTHEDEGFISSVKLEVSNDLDRWSSLVTGAILAHLSYGDYILVQRILKLPRFKGKYLRLIWPAGKDGAHVVGVEGLFPGSLLDQQRRWKEAVPARLADAPADYSFTSDAYLPMDRIRIRLPQRNTLVQVKLKSRLDQERAWRIRYKGLLYNLQVEGASLTKDIIMLPPGSDRYWLLSVAPGGGGIGAGMPVFDMGWVPHKLLFVARGDPPFLLAYGSTKVNPDKLQIGPLLQGLKQNRNEHFIKTAKLGEIIELGGERLLSERAPIQWKHWILWAVLSAGVMIVGLMAWRLYRQMNSPDSPS